MTVVWIISQGEDAATTRLIQDTVSITEVPSIMQAMGFYPSEKEIEDMINEVRYSAVTEGALIETISFGDLIKCESPPPRPFPKVFKK
jgi:cilia- and flagella-associated protein 251